MLNRIFNTTCRLFITGMLLFLYSCKPIPTEAEAINQNQSGIKLMNAGKYKQALIEFYNAIKNPKLTPISKGTIFRNMALTYQELNELDSSVHYYSIAAKNFRKNGYDYLTNMACVDLLTGKTNKAINKLNKAAVMDPDGLSVNNILGLIYLGDYGEEFNDVEKALEFNKKAFEINSSRITEDILGRNYYALGHYELSEMHFERIHKESPDVLIYKLNLGMIKYKIGKINEGDRFFSMVILQDSTYKETIDIFKHNNR